MFEISEKWRLFEAILEVQLTLSKPSKPKESHVYVHTVIVELGTKWR